MKSNNVNKFYGNRFVIAGLLLIIFFSILFITFRLLKKEDLYAIEIKSKSEMVLHFDKKNEVIKMECLNDQCKNSIDSKVFNNITYDDLQKTLEDKLASEISEKGLRIRVVSGNKDISDLKKAFVNAVNEDDKDDVEHEDIQSNINENSENQNEPNEETNKIEEESTDKKEEQSKPNQNEKPVESKPTVEINPLNITKMWIWSYSWTNVEFDHYSKSPMKYKNYGDAVAFGNSEGYIQIFDLKSQGITKNDACVAFTYNDENRNMPAASTIVPIYTGGKVTYKKFCFGVDDIKYDEIHNQVQGDSTSDLANVYEWKNNKWEYIGVFEDVTFDVMMPYGYVEKFYITTLAQASYEWVRNDQREEWNAYRDAKIDELDEKKHEIIKNSYNDPDWEKKINALDKEKEELLNTYNEDMYQTWYDYLILKEK